MVLGTLQGQKAHIRKRTEGQKGFSSNSQYYISILRLILILIFLSPELAQMEACLDENPDFFMVSISNLFLIHWHHHHLIQDYLMRKGSRPMIDKWLTAHAKAPVEDTDSSSARATRYIPKIPSQIRDVSCVLHCNALCSFK